MICEFKYAANDKIIRDVKLVGVETNNFLYSFFAFVLKKIKKLMIFFLI